MKKKQIILIHFAFWLFILAQRILNYVSENIKELFSLQYIIFTLLSVVHFYLFYSIIFVYLSRIKNKIAAWIFGIILVFIASGLQALFYYALGYFTPNFGGISWKFYWIDLRSVLVTSIYALMVRITVDWLRNQQLQAEMKLQQQTSEIALLRFQINPHFLFNTLNNIYSLVYKKSDEAPSALMKLSEILRYMLYDSNSNYVPLDKEIKYLQGFIELQQLRLRETEFVQFIIEGSTIDKTIAPMLLIPFIENAFKHGSKKHDVPGIIIKLTTDTNKILFEIMNYISKTSLVNKDSATGIGMKNVQRRLELLYPNKHKLDKIEKDNMYIIKLELGLI